MRPWRRACALVFRAHPLLPPDASDVQPATAKRLSLSVEAACTNRAGRSSPDPPSFCANPFPAPPRGLKLRSNPKEEGGVSKVVSRLPCAPGAGHWRSPQPTHCAYGNQRGGVLSPSLPRPGCAASSALCSPRNSRAASLLYKRPSGSLPLLKMKAPPQFRSTSRGSAVAPGSEKALQCPGKAAAGGKHLSGQWQ